MKDLYDILNLHLLVSILRVQLETMDYIQPQLPIARPPAVIYQPPMKKKKQKGTSQ